MKKKYLNFIRGVSINKTGKTGVVLATSSFVAMIFLELLRVAGVLTNTYIGLITYLLLPTLFVIGLVFIPFGWMKYGKANHRDGPGRKIRGALRGYPVRPSHQSQEGYPLHLM